MEINKAPGNMQAGRISRTDSSKPKISIQSFCCPQEISGASSAHGMKVGGQIGAYTGVQGRDGPEITKPGAPIPDRYKTGHAGQSKLVATINTNVTTCRWCVSLNNATGIGGRGYSAGFKS